MEIPYKAEELEEIVTGLKLDLYQQPKRIFYINGVAGSGKSTIVNNIFEHIENTQFCDFVMRVNSGQSLDFIVEFILALTNSFVDIKNGRLLKIKESQFNYNWLFEVLEYLREQSEANGNNDFEKLLSQIKLYSKYQDMPEKLTNDDFAFTYKKSKDIDVLFNIQSILTESLLVDLMSNFYPINKTTTLDDYLNNIKPLKIIVFLEDYTSISSSVNDYLINNLFRTVFFKSYNDFKYYKPGKNSYDLSISNFFDFRFVIAGREVFTDIQKNRLETEYGSLFYELYLEGFSRDNIEETIIMNKLNPEFYLEDFEEISDGNPLMIEQLIKSVKSSKSTIDILTVYENYESSILFIYNQKERGWIKAAAFLESITPVSLRPFDEVGEDYKEAYQFILKCDELVDRDAKANGRITFIKIVVDCLKDRMSVENPQKYEKYEDNSRTIDNLSRLVESLNDEEFEVVRNLAYYTRFEIEFVAKNVLQDSKVDLRGLTQNHKFIFSTYKFSKSIKYDYLDYFVKYNQAVDIDNFYDKRNEVKSLWEDYQIHLEEQNYKFRTKLETISTEVESREDVKFDLEKKYDTLQQKLSRLGKNEKALTNKLVPYKYEVNPVVLSITSVSTIVSFVLLGFSKSILGMFTQDPLIVTLTFIFILIISLGLLTSVIIPIFKIMRIKIKQRDIEKYEDQLEKYAAIKIELNEQKDYMQRDINKATDDLNKVKSISTEINSELNNNALKLKEPFYQPPSNDE